MTRMRSMPLAALTSTLIMLLGGCATRPVNPPITQVDPGAGYRYEVRQSRTKEAGVRTPLDNVRRIVVFVVNSLSAPATNWDRSEDPPGIVATLLKSAGTPIDLNSFENVEQLRDTAAKWRTMRRIAESEAMAANTDPAVAKLLRVPKAEIYAIDVSFAALADKAEFEYLNEQPTSFVLPPEAVDRLRAAGGTIILASPEFRRLLKDLDAEVVVAPK